MVFHLWLKSWKASPSRRQLSIQLKDRSRTQINCNSTTLRWKALKNKSSLYKSQASIHKVEPYKTRKTSLISNKAWKVFKMYANVLFCSRNQLKLCRVTLLSYLRTILLSWKSKEMFLINQTWWSFLLSVMLMTSLAKYKKLNFWH